MTVNDTHRMKFGPFEVDLHTHELWKFGTRIKLIGQPFEILEVLLSRPGQLVTRDELRARLWPADTFVDFNHGLNAAVNKLRDALSDSADSPRYVETLPRRGYRFIATIEPVKHVAPTGAANAPAVLAPPVAAVGERAASAPAITLARDKSEQRRAFGLKASAAVLAVLLVGAYLLKVVSRYRGADESEASPLRMRALPVVGAYAPAFSPDGNSVVLVRGDGVDSGIFTMPVGSDSRTQLTRYAGDCCPVWSPDGRSIAFARYSNKALTIHVVPADGGAEQKRDAESKLSPTAAAYNPAAPGGLDRQVNTEGVVPQHGEIDWSIDGKSIAFSGPSGIYVVALDGSAMHRLTEPPPLAQDWGPQFSPDGQKLLFVRNHQVGSPDELWVSAANGSNAARIVSEPGRIVSSPQWSFDGRAAIYSSNRTGHPTLWRVMLDAPDSPIPIKEAGSPAWDPAVSRHGYRLAYEHEIRSLSIWQYDLSSGDNPPSVLVSTTSDTDQGPGAQFSPDGQKLAYMSDHSRTMEIWISNRDGRNPYQLTAVGGAGTPRWSPDSQSIAFDVNTNGGTRIMSINLRGGAPQIQTADSFHGAVPSWSHDGKWIFFASTQSGQWQVWKVPSNGGVPVQITRQGGHAALESPDGKYVYYAKNALAEPEIWQVRADGTGEKPLPLVRPGTWASWQVIENGILFVGPSLGHQAVLNFYEFAKQRTTTVKVLDRVPFWLGATSDGRTVAFDQPGQEQSQTMLVDNFR